MTDANTVRIAAHRLFFWPEKTSISEVLPEHLDNKFWAMFGGKDGISLIDIMSADWYEVRVMAMLLFAETLESE
jgi:hypothetical protein